MFLDKLILETTPKTNKPKKRIDPDDVTRKVKEADITINNWEIIINEIKRDKFVLNNVKLVGSLKNNIFDFSMKDMKFANGVKLKLKIYSGKKYKTVYLVSGYSKDEKVDGTCGWMTNMLSFFIAIFT